MKKNKANIIIRWTPKMSIGIEEIDGQHKKFIEIINDFCNDFGENKTRPELQERFKELINYANLHFKTEEDYFNKFDYEFKEEHKQKHSELRDIALNFQERFKKESGGVAFEFLVFLANWLSEHLEAEDKKYIKCFCDHGL